MRPGASPQSRRYVFTGPGEVSSLVTDPPGTPVTPCSIMIIRKGEERRKKREKFYIYSDDTHTNNMVTHLYGHTHTTPSHTTLSHTTLSHTHNSFTQSVFHHLLYQPCLSHTIFTLCFVEEADMRGSLVLYLFSIIQLDGETCPSLVCQKRFKLHVCLAIHPDLRAFCRFFLVVVFKRKFRSMCSPTISEVRPRHLESLGCASKSLRNEDTPLVEIGMRNPILNANWIRFLLDSSSNPVKHLNAMVLPKSVRFAGLPFFLPKNLTQHDDLFVLEYFGRLWI